MVKNNGKEYEHIVAAIHSQFAGQATVKEDDKIVGKSGRERQIDVSIRSQVVGYEVLIIVQCKDYKRKVDIEKVDSLMGTLEDVGAVKGVLVSDSGFSQGAIDRAKQNGKIDLVSVIDIENKKLKTRLYIPYLAQIRRVKWVQFSIHETSKVHSVFDAEMNNNMRNKFAVLWNQGELDGEPGVHSYTDLVIDKPEQKREVTYSYEVENKKFYKQIGLEKGSGIFDVMKGSFMSKEILTEVIRIDEIETSWKDVTEEEIEPTNSIGIMLFAELPQMSDNL